MDHLTYIAIVLCEIMVRYDNFVHSLDIQAYFTKTTYGDLILYKALKCTLPTSPASSSRISCASKCINYNSCFVFTTAVSKKCSLCTVDTPTTVQDLYVEPDLILGEKVSNDFPVYAKKCDAADGGIPGMTSLSLCGVGFSGDNGFSGQLGSYLHYYDTSQWQIVNYYKIEFYLKTTSSDGILLYSDSSGINSPTFEFIVLYISGWYGFMKSI